ncbi:MAG: type VI secretion system Vgr family protein, partial [Bryobacteraceae bacterium]
MATSFTQDERPFRVYTPLGNNVLLLENVDGEEAISRPFEYRLDLVSENDSIDPASLIRQPVHVEIDLASGDKRYIHGRVAEFRQLGRRDTLTCYRAVIRPWLWFLSLWSDCKIFQNKAVPDIVEQIFKDRGFTDFTPKLYGSYATRDYCVQYRESTLDFISRLLEDEGIFYYFEHTDSKHNLILTDSPQGYVVCPNQSSARVNVETGSYQEDDVIDKIERVIAAGTGQVTLNDYNFTKPSQSLKVNVEGKDPEEIYDYPGGYEDRGGGDSYANVRLEEEEMPETVLTGSGNTRAFLAGYKFDLKDHYRRDLNIAYLIIHLRISIKTNAYQVNQKLREDYSNQFDSIPATVKFRPPRITPKPVIPGVQSAVVVGPKGEEIYSDNYGRIKVQFMWDRVGTKDENSSCWIRVAQEWAGKNWGTIFIPRIGQEVLVDFLEGDPDRPIITGRVYNAEQMPPYTLPANQTQSGILTRSSSGGSSSNANELRFEDKMGSELVLLHAEKDLTVEVEHDETRTVQHDRTTTITNNETKTVQQGNEKIEIQSGDQTTKVDAGSIDTEAMQSITLKVGQSSIVIDQQGVTIQGMKISIQGTIQVQVQG